MRLMFEVIPSRSRSTRVSVAALEEWRHALSVCHRRVSVLTVSESPSCQNVTTPGRKVTALSETVVACQLEKNWADSSSGIFSTCLENFAARMMT